VQIPVDVDGAPNFVQGYLGGTEVGTAGGRDNGIYSGFDPCKCPFDPVVVGS